MGVATLARPQRGSTHDLDKGATYREQTVNDHVGATILRGSRTLRNFIALGIWSYRLNADPWVFRSVGRCSAMWNAGIGLNAGSFL